MSTQTQLERSVSARVVAKGAAIRMVTDILSRAGQMLAQRILERAYRKAEKKLMELDGRMLRDRDGSICPRSSTTSRGTSSPGSCAPP